MFADRLKELRKSRNITQTDFARSFHISNGTIGNWESGKREPNLETMQKIADYFNVTVDYLIGRSDNHSDQNPLDRQLEGIDFALWGEVRDLTDDEKRDIIEFVKFKKSQRSN